MTGRGRHHRLTLLVATLLMNHARTHRDDRQQEPMYVMDQ